MQDVINKQQATINYLEWQIKKNNVIIVGIDGIESNNKDMQLNIINIISDQFQINVTENDI